MDQKWLPIRAYLCQVHPVRWALLSPLSLIKSNYLSEASPLRSGLTPGPEAPATALYGHQGLSKGVGGIKPAPVVR